MLSESPFAFPKKNRPDFVNLSGTFTSSNIGLNNRTYYRNYLRLDKNLLSYTAFVNTPRKKIGELA